MPKIKLLICLLAIPVLGWIGHAAWVSAFDRPSRPRERKVAVYQDSMHPWVKSDRPGKCTVCAMDLTPIYEGQNTSGIGDDLVVLSSNSISVLNVQTEQVKRQPLRFTLRVAGTLEANETLKTIVSAPAPGRIEGLNVEYAGVEVQKGQPLITFYSPELAQEKRRYLLRARSAELLDRGVATAQAGLEADPYYNDLLAPQSGTVVERNVFKGQYVAEGDKLLTIVDSAVVWFRFDVYEQQLPWVAGGQRIQVTVPAIPGKALNAVISFIEPTINEATRTVKVRADLENPLVGGHGPKHRLLRYGMYAEGWVQADAPDTLAVSRTAILFPGQQAYAYVDKGSGAYERRRVKIGRQGDGLCEVLHGLEEGERVVTAGNVLIDSQAELNQSNPTEDADREETVIAPAPGDRVDGGQIPRSAVSAAGIYGTAQSSEFLSQTQHEGFSQIAATPRKDTPAERLSMRPVRRPSSPRASGPGIRSGDDGIMDAVWSRAAELRAAKPRVAGTNNSPEMKSPAGPPLTARQCQELSAFLAVADGISQSLAADDLGKVNQSITNLTAVLPALHEEFDGTHRWGDLIQRLLASSKLHPAPDLVEARKQFLPFSAKAVELAKQIRTEEPRLSSVKIYHCPMAPKPGVWLQANGPLRNPFYGAKMLTCGEEVIR